MTASVHDVADKTFDYIIIGVYPVPVSVLDNVLTVDLGGGAAGLTVAARLSEDGDVSVCVLEAGGRNLNDPMICTCTYFLRVRPLPLTPV